MKRDKNAKIIKDFYVLCDFEYEDKFIGGFYSFEEMLNRAMEFLGTDNVNIDYENQLIYSYRVLTYQQFKIEMRLP